MKRLSAFFVQVRQQLLSLLLLASVTLFLLWYRLGSLVSGVSSLANQSLRGTASLRAIAQNPVYLPYKLGEYIVFKLGLNTPMAVRSVSAILGACGVAIFYLLVARWHTKRLATFATILLLSSTWFLINARTATPYILYMLSSVLLLYFAALVFKKASPKQILMVGLFAFGVSLYTPGMQWLLLLGGIWQLKPILRALKQIPWLAIVGTICLIVILAPVGYAIYYNHHFVLQLLSIPTNPQPLLMLKRLAIVPYELFIHGPKDPTTWLARLPILDVFTGTIFVVGLYSYYLRLKFARTRFLLGMGLLLVLLIAILNISIVAVMPFVFIAIADGLTLLLQQWLTVFPRNPIAKNLGFIVVMLAILVSAWFQTTRYFVAWPHNPATKAGFGQRLIR